MPAAGQGQEASRGFGANTLKYKYNSYDDK